MRRRVAHVFVFFIFVVSNAGGLLTPLGDPPLFLGFLRGVPFTWTLRLWREWALRDRLRSSSCSTSWTRRSSAREDLATPGDLDELAVAHQVPLHIAGAHNVLWLAGVVVVLLASGTLAPPPGVTEAALDRALPRSSWFTTPAAFRRENGFTWGPILEVAVLFAGIFATMIPALAILNARGGELGLAQPWQFFWASGRALVVARQRAHLPDLRVGGERGRRHRRRRPLAARRPRARAELLRAVSLGAVLMGANTYIGNGPNFMVKAIAEEARRPDAELLRLSRLERRRSCCPCSRR